MLRHVRTTKLLSCFSGLPHAPNPWLEGRMWTAEAGACRCRGWGYLPHWLSRVLRLSHLLPLGTSLHHGAISKAHDTIFLVRKWSQDYKMYRHITKSGPTSSGARGTLCAGLETPPPGPAPAPPAPGVEWSGLHPDPHSACFLCVQERLLSISLRTYHFIFSSNAFIKINVSFNFH